MGQLDESKPGFETPEVETADPAPKLDNLSNIALAFDTGGATGGAFFAGFVKRIAEVKPELLEDIAEMSGTSAGAVIAVLTSAGKAEQAPEIWQRIIKKTCESMRFWNMPTRMLQALKTGLPAPVARPGRNSNPHF